MMAQTIQTQRPCRQIALSHRFPSEEEGRGRDGEGERRSVGPVGVESLHRSGPALVVQVLDLLVVLCSPEGG
jgi:hypothetical protein